MKSGDRQTLANIFYSKIQVKPPILGVGRGLGVVPCGLVI